MYVFKVCTSKCMCVCACAFVYRPEVDVEYLLQCPSPYFETNLLSLSLWSCSSSTGRLACLELRKNVQFLIFFLAKGFPILEWMWFIKLKCLTNITGEPCETLTIIATMAVLLPWHLPTSLPWLLHSSSIQERTQALFIFFSLLSSLQSSGFAQRFCCSLFARTCLNSPGCSLRAFGEVAVTFSSWAIGVTNELIKVYLLKAVGILGWILEQKKRLSGKVSEIQIKSGV